MIPHSQSSNKMLQIFNRGSPLRIVATQKYYWWWGLKRLLVTILEWVCGVCYIDLLICYIGIWLFYVQPPKRLDILYLLNFKTVKKISAGVLFFKMSTKTAEEKIQIHWVTCSPKNWSMSFHRMESTEGSAWVGMRGHIVVWRNYSRWSIRGR